MQRDIIIGAIAEQKVLKILVDLGWEAEQNLDKKTRALYDISASKGELALTVEVKNDVYAAKSGNLAIEFYNTKSNKPSGLGVTQAILWAVNLHDELWIANTEKLRKFVDTEKPHKVISSGGDDNAALYLFKKDHILPLVFHRIDNLELDAAGVLILELMND